jgi:hypothetical protein
MKIDSIEALAAWAPVPDENQTGCRMPVQTYLDRVARGI